jgi:hypothetical protein
MFWPRFIGLYQGRNKKRNPTLTEPESTSSVPAGCFKQRPSITTPRVPPQSNILRSRAGCFKSLKNRREFGRPTIPFKSSANALIYGFLIRA